MLLAGMTGRTGRRGNENCSPELLPSREPHFTATRTAHAPMLGEIASIAPRSSLLWLHPSGRSFVRNSGLRYWLAKSSTEYGGAVIAVGVASGKMDSGH